MVADKLGGSVKTAIELSLPFSRYHSVLNLNRNLEKQLEIEM